MLLAHILRGSQASDNCMIASIWVHIFNCNFISHERWSILSLGELTAAAAHAAAFSTAVCMLCPWQYFALKTTVFMPLCSHTTTAIAINLRARHTDYSRGLSRERGHVHYCIMGRRLFHLTARVLDFSHWISYGEWLCFAMSYWIDTQFHFFYFPSWQISFIYDW